MALAYRPGASLAYSLRKVSWIIAFVSIFLFGPFILMAFWWRSMPKHDEVLTVVLCGLPLIASLYAGTISFLDLRRVKRGPEPRHKAHAFWWGIGLSISALGWLTTEGTLEAYARMEAIGPFRFQSFYQRKQYPLAAESRTFVNDLFSDFIIINNNNPSPVLGDAYYLSNRELESRWWMQTPFPWLLVPANLAGVAFVETPPGWLPRDEAEMVFRPAWCQAQGLGNLTCGPGPLAAIESPRFLAYQRKLWCQQILPSDAAEDACDDYFAALDTDYSRDWETARADALAALPKRDLSSLDLRHANLRQARLEGADLRAARLEGADLRVARLDGANLSEARLEGANLEWARLEGAALWDVDCSRLVISQQQIDATFGDGTVILPAPLTRPAHWPPQKLDGETFFSEYRKWRADPAAYTPPPPPAP